VEENGVNATQGMMVAPGGDIRKAAGCGCDPAASKDFEMRWGSPRALEAVGEGQPATRTESASPISVVLRAGLPVRSARSAETASSMRAASAS
jgi:hypothetical protein